MGAFDNQPNLQCLYLFPPPLACSEQASKRRQAAAVQSNLDRANRDPRNPSQAIVYLYSEAGWCVWRRLCPQSLALAHEGLAPSLAPAIAYTAPHAALANFGRARRCTACKSLLFYIAWPTVRCMIVAPVSLLPMIVVPVSILLSGRLIDSLVVYPEHHFLDAVDQGLDGA